MKLFLKSLCLAAVAATSLSIAPAEAAGGCRAGWHPDGYGRCKRTVYYTPHRVHHRHYAPRRAYYAPDQYDEPVYAQPQYVQPQYVPIPMIGLGFGGGYRHHRRWYP